MGGAGKEGGLKQTEEVLDQRQEKKWELKFQNSRLGTVYKDVVQT